MYKSSVIFPLLVLIITCVTFLTSEVEAASDAITVLVSGVGVGVGVDVGADV